MELLHCFRDIQDFRRAQARQYELPNVLMIIVLSMLACARSYRMTEMFIQTHLKALNKAFGTDWKRAPSHVQLRNILLGTPSDQLEAAFRRFWGTKRASPREGLCIAVDGKTLRGSIDRYEGLKAMHQLMAYDLDSEVILAHVDLTDKEGEIPAVEALIRELGLEGVLYTVDALHCQKKPS
jgi:hypothetical protein